MTAKEVFVIVCGVDHPHVKRGFDIHHLQLPKASHASEGTSFKPLLEDPTRQGKSAAFSEYQREGYHGRALREKRYRYTEWSPMSHHRGGKTLRELYDVMKDPREYNKLSSGARHAELVNELSRCSQVGWHAALP